MAATIKERDETLVATNSICSGEYDCILLVYFSQHVRLLSLYTPWRAGVNDVVIPECDVATFTHNNIANIT